MPILAFVVAIACISPLPDGAVGVRWMVLSVVVPAWFLIRRGSIPTRGHALLLLFMYWSIATLAWAPSWLDGLNIAWGLALFVALTFVGASMRPVYIGAGIGLAINGLVVGAQLLGWDGITQAVPPAGLFFNKNLGPEMTILVLIGTIGELSWRWWLVLSPMLITIFASPISRAPLMAAFAASILQVWRRNRFVGVLIFIVVFGGAFALVAMPSRLDHGSQRVEVWVNSVVNWSFAGHGLGSFVYVYPWFEQAHNDFLQVFYETGVPGLLLFVAFLVYCLRGTGPTEQLVLVAFMVEGCFGFPLYMPGTAFIAALAAGSLLRGRPLVRDLLPEC